MIAGEPCWLKKHLHSGDTEKIRDAVKRAEAHTSGEIIPMVVRSSTDHHHLTTFLSLVLFIILLLLGLESFLLRWDPRLVLLLPFFALLCFFVARPLSQISWVRRFFISKKDQEIDVHQRAELEFYRGRYHLTREHTAVLIFVSLLERRVVVLADQGIAAKLPESAWGEVVRILIQEVRHDRLAEGFVKAVGKCGELLSKHFPATEHQSDQIVNQLVIKE